MLKFYIYERQHITNRTTVLTDLDFIQTHGYEDFCDFLTTTKNILYFPVTLSELGSKCFSTVMLSNKYCQMLNKYCQKNVRILPVHCQIIFSAGSGLTVLSGMVSIISSELAMCELRQENWQYSIGNIAGLTGNGLTVEPQKYFGCKIGSPLPCSATNNFSTTTLHVLYPALH